MTPAERLQAAIEEGRLIRHDWRKTATDGRELVCLLAALSPECGTAKSAVACPADVMPRWLAHLTPWMDDVGTAAAWPGMIRRYADLAGRWHVLTAEDWRRLDFACRAVSVRHAQKYAASPSLPAIDGVLLLLDRAAAGKIVSDDEWTAAAKAAKAWTAAWAAAKAAKAAAAAEAAWAAAEAAAWAAAKAATAEAAWAAWAATAATADTITAGILDKIEAAIVERE